MVELRGLCWSNGAPGRPAAGPLHARVPRGQCHAFLGGGALDRMALLDCILGVTRPRAGQVLVDDVDLGQLTALQLARWRRRHVLYVPAPADAAPRDLAFPAVMLAMPAGCPSLHGAAGLDGAGRLRGDRTGSGASGQNTPRGRWHGGLDGRGRAAWLTRRLHRRAQVCVLDDPWAGLAEEPARGLARQIRRRLAAQGRTGVVTCTSPGVAACLDHVHELPLPHSQVDRR